jgi:hypothetical protein
VILRFSNQFQWFAGGDNEVADVDVSTDGGTMWTNVLRMQGGNNGFPTPNNKIIDITSVIAANPANVRIRFHYYVTVGPLGPQAPTGQELFWGIDGVTVSAFTINPSSQGFSSTSGSGTVNVTAPSGVAWTAVSNDSWLTPMSGGGMGSGSVNYMVSANASASLRTATMTVAGNTFTVTQSGVGGGPIGLMFYPLAYPVRLLDTRTGFSACHTPNAKIPGNTSRTQPARGVCDNLTIPASAAASTGNITTVQSGGGYLTLYPSDAVQPTVANSNYNPDEILNNVFTVGLGSDGAFKIFVTSNTDIVIDVTGYYAPPGVGGLYFHPLPKPIRLLETRPTFGGCNTPGAPLPGNVDSSLLAWLTCDTVTIPTAARAITGNATTVNPLGPGFPYLTLFPANATRPVVASSNYLPGQIMNAPFTVGLSPAGQFKLYPTTQTDMVIDVLGYYSAEAADANGAGLLFYPLPKPVRLLETRVGFGGCYTTNAKLLAGSTRTQPARGVCDTVTIAASALGIVGNATVVNTSGGYLTFWPSTAPQPTVATSNFLPGQVFNRHFTVGLGAGDGAFKIFTQFTTDLVIDVSGYFAP